MTPLPLTVSDFDDFASQIHAYSDSIEIPSEFSEVLESIGEGALFGALAPIVIPVGLAIIGFGVSGIVGGSIAACCQSPDVLKGSCFAVTQSFMATLMVCGNPIAVLVIFLISTIIGAFLGGFYGLDVL